jgi:hypothetical protein
MEATHSFETSVYSKPTRRHIPEDSIHHNSSVFKEWKQTEQAQLLDLITRASFAEICVSLNFSTCRHDTRLGAAYKTDWLHLSKLTRELGSASGCTYGSLTLLFFAISVLLSYGFVVELTHSFSLALFATSSYSRLSPSYSATALREPLARCVHACSELVQAYGLMASGLGIFETNKASSVCCLFYTWLHFRPWKWWRSFLPKRKVFFELYSFLSHKTLLTIRIAVTTKQDIFTPSLVFFKICPILRSGVFWECDLE